MQTLDQYLKVCRTIIGSYLLRDSYAVLIPSNPFHARQLQGPANLGGNDPEAKNKLTSILPYLSRSSDQNLQFP